MLKREILTSKGLQINEHKITSHFRSDQGMQYTPFTLIHNTSAWRNSSLVQMKSSWREPKQSALLAAQRKFNLMSCRFFKE